MKTNRFQKLVTITVLALWLETAHAVEFEKLGKAVATALGTTKAKKAVTKVDSDSIDVYYADGKAAVVQKGIYEPNCTHTWVIGIDKATSNVEQIRVVEMSCPHAYPTRAASFLDQYKGKGPANLAKLDKEISTVAKATGSAELTTVAVKKAIRAVTSLKGKI